MNFKKLNLVDWNPSHVSQRHPSFSLLSVPSPQFNCHFDFRHHRLLLYVFENWVNGIIQHTVFCAWLPSCNIVCETHLSCCCNFYSIVFIAWSLEWYIGLQKESKWVRVKTRNVKKMVNKERRLSSNLTEFRSKRIGLYESQQMSGPDLSVHFPNPSDLFFKNLKIWYNSREESQVT